MRQAVGPGGHDGRFGTTETCGAFSERVACGAEHNPGGLPCLFFAFASLLSLRRAFRFVDEKTAEEAVPRSR